MLWASNTIRALKWKDKDGWIWKEGILAEMWRENRFSTVIGRRKDCSGKVREQNRSTSTRWGGNEHGMCSKQWGKTLDLKKIAPGEIQGWPIGERRAMETRGLRARGLFLLLVLTVQWAPLHWPSLVVRCKPYHAKASYNPGYNRHWC